jgi:hypothetical protein
VKDEDNGKFRALNVQSADGSPCPIPPKRDDKNEKDATNKNGSSDGNKTDGDEAAEGGDGGATGGKKKNRRKRGGKKKGSGGGPAAGEGGDGSGTGQEEKNDTKKTSAAKTKKQTWETSLEDDVKKSLADRGIKVDRQGRTFLSVGDARIKLGTDSYAALAHSDGLLAEGEWSVEPNGKITVVWTKVLKWGEGGGDVGGSEGAWSPSSADAEASLLVANFSLADGESPILFHM